MPRNNFPDVDTYISETDDAVNISKIIVDEAKRNQGIGTKAMQDIIDYADSVGKRIELTPSSDFGGNLNKLKDFYKKLGFKENKGRNKDYEIFESMYKQPSVADRVQALRRSK